MELKTNLGIDKVNNTSDLDKPVSTKTQAAIDVIAINFKTDKYLNLFVGQNAGNNYQDTYNYGYGTNTAIGANSLQNNTDYWNVAIGGNAISMGKWSRQNTAVGYNSMYSYKKGFDNVAIGYASLSGLDTGIYNTALGTQTLINLKNSNNNTALGYRALAALKTGANNLAVGYQAGYSLDSGNNNIFIGTNAGAADIFTKINNKLIISNVATPTPLIYGAFDTKKLTINGDLIVTGTFSGNATLLLNADSVYSKFKVDSNNLRFQKSSLNFVKKLQYYGVGNIAIGDSALYKLDSGYANIAIGYKSLINNTSGQSNVAIGGNNSTMTMNTTGWQNNAIGTSALNSNTIGNRNNAFGTLALSRLSNGIANSAFGNASLAYMLTGNENAAFGRMAAYQLKTGNYNSVLGNSTLASDTAGDYNVAVGYRAGAGLKNGSKNIFIGYNAGSDSTFSRANNVLAIDNGDTSKPLIYGEFDRNKITINGDLTITGRPNLNLSNDTTIKALKKTIDSLVAALSARSIVRIDSSNLASSNPVIANRFLDSTFLPSINFNGTSTYIQMGATGLLGNRIYGNNFTVETWVKSYKVSDTLQFIYGTGYQWNGNVGSFKLALYRGRITASIGNFSGYNLSTDYPRDSLWHHVVFTHNNVAKVGIIYIDGIEKTRLTNTGTLNMVNGSMGIEGIGSNLDIGNEPPREFFKGSLRKLRVSRGIQYNANFSPSFNYVKGDSTLAFYELNDLGTRIKASDSAYNGTLYNGTWSVLNTTPINLNDSLVAYYPFSGNANDSSGNGNNGIVTNALLTTDRFGNVNSAYLFNGSSSSIRVPNSSTLKSSNFQLSISAWIKINQFSGNPKTGVIVDKSGSVSGDWGLSYYDWDANTNYENLKYGAFVRTNSSILTSGLHTTTSPSIGQWVHLVYSFDGNSNANLYINGNLESSVGNGGNPISLWPNSQDMFIGKSGTINGTFYSITGSNYNYFNGSIDDVRIYKKALNADEVRYLSTH
jgi:hypothetical protein